MILELQFEYRENNNSYQCTGITPTDWPGKVVIPDSYNGLPVTSIGESAFEKCSLSAIHIPRSVYSIGYRAFHSCPNLVEVTFEENSELKYVSACAFAFCGTKMKVQLPERVYSVSLEVFDHTIVDLEVSEICDIELPLIDCAYPLKGSSLSRYSLELGPIEEDANRNQFRLNKEKNGYIAVRYSTSDGNWVVLPDTFNGLPVVELDNHVFSSCTYAWYIYIPATVIRGHDMPFYGLDELLSVQYGGTTSAWKNMKTYCHVGVSCSDGEVE